MRPAEFEAIWYIFKCHPKDILDDKDSNLTSNMAFKTRKRFQVIGY